MVAAYGISRLRERVTSPIILASASPRRRQFLCDLGVTFHIQVADVDELPHLGESAADLALRLAVEKVQAVARLQPSGLDPIIIGADTVVALGPVILGKPRDAAEAIQMLRRLRGRVHDVHSAVSVLSGGRQSSRISTTRVFMRTYTDREIRAYVDSGDPMDKAGAYGVQHLMFAPVERLDGCVAGVMGLPLGDLVDLLSERGISISTPVRRICQRYTPFACCQA